MEDMHNCIVQHGDFTLNCSHHQQGACGGMAFCGPLVANAVASSSCCGLSTGRHGIPSGLENDVLLDNGNLNKLRAKHNSVTHCLDPCPPLLADCEIKSCMCKDAVVAIHNGGEDDWGVKTQFLCDRIQFPLIKSAAKGKVAMTKDCMDMCCTWTWKGVANGSGLAVLDDLNNPVCFARA